jgi:DNA-binding CsgD family transcriptional regulator
VKEPGAVGPLITLPARQLQAVLDAAECLSRAMPAEEAIQELLHSLSGLVGCDQLYWNRTHTRHPVHRIEEIGLPHAPAIPLVSNAYNEWAAHRPEHPIMSGEHGPVTAISDVYTPREFKETWLYQEWFRSEGIEHEIGVHLSHPPDEIQVVFLSRLHGRDFDDRDHLILRLLRPHLDAALRRIALPTPRLTPRETEVLRLVRDGLTDRQIARRLAISEATVGKHLQHVYARTGAQSRVQALSLCGAALD